MRNKNRELENPVSTNSLLVYNTVDKRYYNKDVCMLTKNAASNYLTVMRH